MRIINAHESIIIELAQFIQSTLTPFLDFVEKKTEGVCQRFKKVSGMPLHPDIKDDPFAVFDLYQTQIIGFPEDDDKAEMLRLKELVEQLEATIKAKDAELALT